MMESIFKEDTVGKIKTKPVVIVVLFKTEPRADFDMDKLESRLC